MNRTLEQRFRVLTYLKSQRYRERVRDRKPPEPEAVDEAARVITKKFFRGVLRPAGLLRKPRARAAKSLATLLLANVPASRGACPKRERRWKEARI